MLPFAVPSAAVICPNKARMRADFSGQFLRLFTWLLPLPIYRLSYRTAVGEPSGACSQVTHVSSAPRHTTPPYLQKWLETSWKREREDKAMSWTNIYLLVWINLSLNTTFWQKNTHPQPDLWFKLRPIRNRWSWLLKKVSFWMWKWYV